MKGVYTIECFTGKGKRGGAYFWRLRYPNGKVAATSEGVHNKADRDDAAKLLHDAFKPGRCNAVEVKG